MDGAVALKNDVLKGKYLINLDAEDDKVLFIGCAYGCRATWTKQIAYQDIPEDYRVYSIEIKNGISGHSG